MFCTAATTFHSSRESLSFHVAGLSFPLPPWLTYRSSMMGSILFKAKRFCRAREAIASSDCQRVHTF
jgi:hypothetical protein